MQLNARIDGTAAQLTTRIDSAVAPLRERIDLLAAQTNARFDVVNQSIATAQLRGLVLLITLAAGMLGTMARGFGWL
jgi:hypothetical protein